MKRSPTPTTYTGPAQSPNGRQEISLQWQGIAVTNEALRHPGSRASFEREVPPQHTPSYRPPYPDRDAHHGSSQLGHRVSEYGQNVPDDGVPALTNHPHTNETMAQYPLVKPVLNVIPHDGSVLPTHWTTYIYPSANSNICPPPPYQYQHRKHVLHEKVHCNGTSDARNVSSKRKTLRATQACEECRARKRRCDEGSPCSVCKEYHMKCKYRDTPPAKTDNNVNVTKLLKCAEENSKKVEELKSRIDGFTERIGGIVWQSAQPNGRLRRWTTPEPAWEDNVRVRRRHPELDDHRTAAHKLLLLWPSVRSLLKAADVNRGDGYVMEAEDRGVLRLWTRGEGIDEDDGTRSDGRASCGEGNSEGRALTPHTDGRWGFGFPLTPTSFAGQQQPCGAGGLKANGEVNLDASTIGLLYNSYIRHIHIMHPFLDQQGLTELFDEFIQRYSTGRPRASAFAVTGSDQRSLKRQRSEGDGRQVPTERSPGTAIVYLVMALGQICLHRAPLRAAVRGEGLENMDVVPGIAYYAKATEIIGDQGDGNNLVHAQIFLLAGLYKGQLARVKESMSWITMASRAILILLDRYQLYNDNYWTAYGDVRRQHERAQTRIKDTRQSLIVLASWTCLQLESDILAELRLPSSAIQNIENLLLMPQQVPEDETYSGLESDGSHEEYDKILMYYTAQLFLRRRLNQVHREIYGPECLGWPLSGVQQMLLGYDTILQTWREGLPDWMQWSDDDPPSSDILAARLRAKYYGARYIINRPFLDYALHVMLGIKDGLPMEEVGRDGYGNPRDEADIHIFKAIEGLGEAVVMQAAKCCVDAAMHSTIAFDGVPDRLIITNIHGTAHAQFGNMLVLCATFTSDSDYMKQLVQTDKFRERLRRTIEFLRKLAPISPTSAADCGILEKFNALLFPASSE